MLDPAVASHLSHPVNYIFVPLSPGTHDPREVRAYEPIGNHGEGGNILYLDGHCKWHKRAEYESIVGAIPKADRLLMVRNQRGALWNNTRANRAELWP